MSARQKAVELDLLVNMCAREITQRVRLDQMMPETVNQNVLDELDCIEENKKELTIALEVMDKYLAKAVMLYRCDSAMSGAKVGIRFGQRLQVHLASNHSNQSNGN